MLTKDTEQNVALYDVLKVVKVQDLGKVDFDNEVKNRNQKVYIPNWFTVDLKTGVGSSCLLHFKNYNNHSHGYILDAINSFRPRRSRLFCSLGFRRSRSA